MKNTTLTYIEKDGKYLMIHKNKRKNDENRDKWLGIGGKIEDKESPFDCARREIREETGLEATSLSYRGIITFVSDKYGTEYMHLFTCADFTGTPLSECDEGALAWIDKRALRSLPMWEGDAIFLDLLDTERRFFSLKLVYEGERLVSSALDFA